MRDNLKNFLYGGISGIVSRTITSPFERLKILRQIFPLKYKNLNFIQSYKYTLFNEGYKGFFKGNLVNCVRVFPQQAVNFSIFNLVNKDFNLNYFTSGAIAGITSYLSIYPLETIRSKLSVQVKQHKYKGLLDCFVKTVSTNGYYSLYKGSFLASIGMIPFQGTNFLVYNYLNDNYNNQNLKIYNSLFFGSLSGIASVSVAYPFDTIKRKLQLSGESGNPKFRGIIHCIKHMYINNGIKSFYRGLIPCYAKIFPANGIYFFMIEILKSNGL